MEREKIFQKNQLIITALALMIAVAGYFSYMNNHIDDGTAAETAANAGTDALKEEYEISDEDPLAAENILQMREPGKNLQLWMGRRLRMQEPAKIHTMRQMQL